MCKRKTTEQFIAEARAIHGYKYDYSKVEYATNKDKVCIICPTHGEFWQRPSDHLKGNRCPQCPRHRKFGVCDVVNPRQYPSYTLWQGLINRCYQQKDYTRNLSYQNCTMCDEWLLYSNFKEWVECPHNGYKKGCDIDKDILCKNNVVYSPQTCCFMPSELNKVFTRRKSSRRDMPIGVILSKSGKYDARMSKYKKDCHIGTFNTPEEAFYAYKTAKEQYIKELAEKYFQEGKITEKVYNALMRYEVEITD